jgi:8-oxo-dGTP diphosphatase
VLVSAGIIHREGRVLVCQRRKVDRHSLKWEFPGGKIEFGETPQQALIRELHEELRIQAIIGAELARYDHRYPDSSCVSLLFFAVAHYAGQPRGRVFKQICWTALPNLPKLDFLEGDLAFVRRLAQGDFNQQLASTVC